MKFKYKSVVKTCLNVKMNILTILIYLPIMYSCEKETSHDNLNIDLNYAKGTVDTTLIINSIVLNRVMHYSIYLPPGYETSTDKFPVLYLLHGMYGNYRDWVNNGMESTLNATIHSKTSSEMVVVIPDGFNAFYCNNYNGEGLMYEDFFINEFIPFVESNYKIKAEKNGRAIAGLSMGGYGATYHAFKRPEVFSSCYSMSGALDIGTSAPDIKEILNSMNQEQLSSIPAYTMECGNEDFLVYKANVNFDQFLTSKNIEHTCIFRPGAHDWAFWKVCLPKALTFVSKYFK